MRPAGSTYFGPLTVLLLLHTVATSALMAPPIFAVPAASDLGVDVVWVGIYPMLVYAAAIASSVLAGGATAAVGPIRTSQACLVLVGAGTWLLATGSLIVMAVGALLIGVGYGPITPAGSDLLKSVTPVRLQPVVFSVKQTAVPAGGAIAGAVVPQLVYSGGWRVAAFLMGAACIVLAILVEPLRSHFDGQRPQAGGPSSLLGLQSLRLVVIDRNYAALGVAGLAFAVVQGVLFTYFVPYLSAEVGMSLVLAGAVMTATQVGGVIGRVVWGFVAAWVNSGMLVLVGLSLAMAVSAAATAFFNASWPVLGITAVGVIFGMTAVGWNGLFFAEIARMAPPGTIGALTGALAAIAYLGVMTGPPLFGLILRVVHSYDIGFFGTASVALLGGAVLLLRRGEGLT